MFISVALLLTLFVLSKFYSIRFRFNACSCEQIIHFPPLSFWFHRQFILVSNRLLPFFVDFYSFFLSRHVCLTSFSLLFLFSSLLIIIHLFLTHSCLYCFLSLNFLFTFPGRSNVHRCCYDICNMLGTVSYVLRVCLS